jgi:hypothetical protein
MATMASSASDASKPQDVDIEVNKEPKSEING